MLAVKSLSDQVKDSASALSDILGVPADDLERILGAHVRQVTWQDREDLLGNLTLKLLEKSQTPDTINGSWCYTLCHNYLVDWYRSRNAVKRPHEEIGEYCEDVDISIYAESSLAGRYVVGEVETELAINYDLLAMETMVGTATYRATRSLEEGVIDQTVADSILDSMPDEIQLSVSKRMIGIRLSSKERVALHRYLKAHSPIVSTL